MIFKAPVECHCSVCDLDFLRYRNRGNMGVCTPCQRKARLIKWKQDNPERKRELNRKWAQLNPEKDKQVKAEWSQRNKEAENAKAAKYRARKFNAMPIWADLHKIKEIYAGCPKGFHVDHIIPLQGEFVTGLHVENNLQYLPAALNVAKSNYYEVA